MLPQAGSLSGPSCVNIAEPTIFTFYNSETRCDNFETGCNNAEGCYKNLITERDNPKENKPWHERLLKKETSQ